MKTMKKLNTYSIPLHTHTIRGKKYNILVLEETNKWGITKCKEYALTSAIGQLDILYISDASVPCSRFMWRSINCVILSDAECYRSSEVYNREVFKKPQLLTLTEIGKSIIDLKLSKKELLKAKGIMTYHTVTIPLILYKKLCEKF